MERRRITTKLISILGLIGAALSKVKVWGHLEDGAVLKQDDIMFDLTQYFDLSGADKESLAFKATQATGEGPSTEIKDSIFDHTKNINNLQYSADSLTLIKYVDERSFIMFYDETTYVYQEMLPNATRPVTYWNKTFKIFTSGKVTCQDAVLSPNRDEILVGCTNKYSSSSKSLWLFRIKREDGEILETKQVDLKDMDIAFTNRLQIGLYDLPQERQKKTYFIIVYNQGRAHQTQTRDFPHFLVFHVVNDEIVEEGEFSLVFEDKEKYEFTMLYDIFEYNNVLLASAGIKNLETIQVVSCQFHATDKEVVCSDSIHDTKIPKTRGFVAMVDISGFWAEYSFDTDMKEGTLKLYVLEGLFNSEGWKRELRSMDNVPAFESEHEWIRRIEGSIDNIVIQWAQMNSKESKNSGLQAYDKGAVLVSWTIGTAELHSDSSIAVMDDMVFFASLTQKDVLVRRYSAPFFWTKGSEFNVENTNILTITATDKDGTASLTASIHQQINPRTKPILDFNPPYLDVMSQSTFELPFTGDSWVSGNALDFSVTYNDSIFSLTSIQHHNKTDVVFRPIPQTNQYQKIMFGDTGAVTYKGDLYTYYSCQFHRHGGATCDTTFTKKGQHDEDIKTDIFSKHGVIGHWSVGKDAKTYVYLAVFEEGTYVKSFDYAAKSVGFTMDVDNNVFVAVSNYDKEFVEVWKVDAHSIESWQFYQNFTANTVGLTRLCPSQLRADPREPTTFHVLSFCQLKEDLHEVQRIVALALKGYRSSLEGKSTALGTGEAREAGVEPNFCPMKDHHIVYTHKHTGEGPFSQVYAVSKHSSFDRYFIDLEKSGFTYVDIFECFSDIEMYAIHGPTEQGVKTYGLFWGEKKYNNAKFANLILRDISTEDWSKMDSYYTGDYIIHVGYKDLVTQNYAATLINPPRIKSKVEHLPGYYETITPVEWTIKASNGFISSSIKGIVYARKTNQTIGYTNRKKWLSSTGWVDIEQFTRIDGPVTKVSLAASESRLNLADRKVNKGALSAGQSPVVFDNYRGDYDNGIGMAIESEGGYGTFYFVKDHEIKGASTKYGADEAYDFASMHLIGGTAKLVFYHGKNGASHMLSAFVTKGLRARSEARFPIPRTATKVRVSSAKDNRRFIGFSHDYFGDKSLFVYSILYNSEKETISINLLHEYLNIEDFDVCRQDLVTHLYFIKVQSPKVEAFEWEVVDLDWQETPKGTLIPDPTRQYWLKNVAASAGVSKNHIVLNTQGTVIFSGDIDIRTKTNRVNNNGEVSLRSLGLIMSWRQYDKYQDYEGWQMYINEDFIVVKAKHMDGTPDAKALVWKRQDSDGSLHTAIELGANRRGGEKSLRDHPVTFFNHPIYGSTVGIGTPDPNYPLDFIAVDNVKVFIPDDYENINFRDYQIVVDGTYEQTVTVEALLTGDLPDPNPPDPNPPGPAFGYWPFIGVIIFLVLAAIVWFIYARKKGDEDSQYRSVDPQTDSGVTDGIFETGLNPKDVIGNEFESATDDKTQQPTLEVKLEKAKDVIEEEKPILGGDDEEENLKFD